MKTLTDHLKDIGLLSYTDSFSDEGCRMIADAVSRALDDRPAVFEPQINIALDELSKSEEARRGRMMWYGAIGYVVKNPYLKNPEKFSTGILREIAGEVIQEEFGVTDFVLIVPKGRRCGPNNPHIFYRKEDAMKDYIKQRLRLKQAKPTFQLEVA